MKTCSRCRRSLPRSAFNRHRQHRDGLQGWCRGCFREEDRQARRVVDAVKSLERQRRRLYGADPELVAPLLEEQEGLCAICRRPPSGARYDRVLHLDHDHETGRIRGFLCGRCNRALGLLGDDVAVLEAAIAYLNKETPT